MTMFVPMSVQAQSIDGLSREQLIQLLLARIAELRALESNDEVKEDSKTKEIIGEAEWYNDSTNTSCVTLDGQDWIYCVGGKSETSVTKRLTFYEPGGRGSGYYRDIELPNMYATSCATDSSVTGTFYCFGGYQYQEPSRSWLPVADIYRFEVDTNQSATWERLDSELPLKTGGLSCSENTDDNKMYCFGGFVSDWAQSDTSYSLRFNDGWQGFANHVVIFDPVTEEVDVVELSELVGTADVACVYATSNEKFYCFGGDNGHSVNSAGDRATSSETDIVYSYDPDRETVKVLDDRLKTPASIMSCTEAKDRNIYCFGGGKINEFNESESLNSIYRLNPRNERLTLLSDKLPKDLAGHSCTLDPGDNEIIYCFGGAFKGTASVVKYEI